MRTSLVLLTLFMCSQRCISAERTYTITAANVIRANSLYKVAVTFLGTDNGLDSQKGLKVDVKITGQIEGSEDVSSDGTITVPAKTTKVLTLKIGNWPQGIYKLVVNGTGAINFVRTTNLAYSNKQFSIFIQTDKAIYQRGQLVQFRVVSVNSELLPYKTGNLLAYITDGQNNRIKQWETNATENGVFEGNLQLSDQPVFGMWQLFAKIEDVSAAKSFEVSEYLLPRYEVSVDAPSFITTRTVDFPVTVTADYTFGGPVSGTYLVNVTQTYCSYTYVTNCPSRPVVLQGNFKGSVTVSIKVGDLQFMDKSLFYGGLTVLAIVTEDSTGIRQNSTASFQMYQQEEKLLLEQDSSFKPQIPHRITVKLLQQDNTPVTNPTEKLNVTTSFDSGVYTDDKFELQLEKNGTASFSVIPPSDAQSLSVVVSYKDITAYDYASLAQSLSDKYVTINVRNSNPKVGDTLRVSVLATFQLKNPISYQVVGRGNIQLAKTVKLNSEDEFSFVLTYDMTPHVRVVVFYVTDCGEIVGDALDVSVDGAIRNKVTLSLSNTTTEPGNNVTMSIKSQPNSLVALLSVDKSVLLLRSGNDITKEEINNALQAYDIGTPTYYDIYNPGIIRRPSGGSFDEIFTYAGLILFTNGLYYKATTCNRPYMYFDRIESFAGTTPVSGSSSLVEPSRVRENFPEVWLYNDVKTDANGESILTVVVPDTITTWVISGFAISDTAGLGLTDRPYNLTVFQPFFLVINLPYSVIRTEEITIVVLVFNNFDEELPVIVSLNKTAEESGYDILEQTETSDRSPVSATKNITVAATDVQGMTFRIRPTKVGYVSLNFRAVSARAGDAVIVKLLVKAEGSPLYFNKATFMDLRKVNNFSTEIDIDIPEDAVPGSQFVECLVSGDFMAQIINNIKDLIRMPSGCGEQNMINFVPDVVCIRYLERIDALSDELESTAKSYLEQGYETQLTYKGNDGSFSAFGQVDNSGSTWLTAFVAKSFNLGRAYITIDEKVITAAKVFLVSKQVNDSGEFREDGRVIHKALQGGSSSGLGLTAFVLICFLEDTSQNNADFIVSINKAVSFLEAHYAEVTSAYDLAIINYALHLANSSSRDDAFAKLQAKKITQGELSYWSYSAPNPDKFSESVVSYDVEATAYAELTYCLRSDITPEDHLPVVRWLISKRNDLGGYYSSQDTVIGIQALGEVAPRFTAGSDSHLEVTIKYLDKSSDFTLNKGNALVLQKLQLPKDVKSVEVTATGNGVGVTQISWNYNVVKNESSSPSFELKPIVSRPNSKSYSVNICGSYLLNGTTNMVLMEVTVLSGYSIILDSLPAPGFVPGLKRVETSNSNTLVVFYFDALPKTPNSVCISLSAIQTYVVGKLKDARIYCYDYYESSKRAEVFYNLS